MKSDFIILILQQIFQMVDHVKYMYRISLHLSDSYYMCTYYMFTKVGGSRVIQADDNLTCVIFFSFKKK